MESKFYDKQLKKRHAKGKALKWAAVSSIFISVTFLVIFLGDMIIKGIPAFQTTYVKVEVTINKETMDNSRKAVEKKYRRVVSRAWLRGLPRMVENNPSMMNTKAFRWVLADDAVDQYIKGHSKHIKSKVKTVTEELQKNGNLELSFNKEFFVNGDSKLPEYAGVKSAVIGTIFTLIVTMLFSFPIGVMTAIYLEEFAPDNRFTQFVEININNLAAIPSILFGLLGLAIFINFFGMPRSSSLVGGLTLGLMTLPVIIVSARAALKSVPDSIKQAGFGLGLTKWQVVKDHVLPLSLPGILTGSIIGLARAIGETAPLILIGMIAYIPDSPSDFMEAATVMPAQIFTWAGMPEMAYREKTAAAILVLLLVLLSLNAIAIVLRNKFERKW